MEEIKKKLIAFLSQKKVVKTIDLAILLIASLSLALILLGAYYLKILQLPSPIDINRVVVWMMLSLIFLYSLKLMVSEKTRIAFQLILFIIVLAGMSAFVAIAKKIILRG